MSVAAIVITFNRIDFLKKVIAALKNQTVKPDEIIVVNNSSSDGTGEWLERQSGLNVITQANTGSSGGQYTGIKAAFDNGHDWIWTMDDDILPHENVLEIISKPEDPLLVRMPLRYTVEDKPFLNDTIEFNLDNPFKSIWVEILSEKHLDKERISVDGPTFEGPLFHRSLVEKIGLPERDFFIYGDDSEYFIRAKKAGYKLEIFTKAKMSKLIKYNMQNKQFDWKSYFVIRNLIAIDVLHGSVPVRLLRPFAYAAAWMKAAGKPRDILTVIKALKNGYFYKSNK
ncbi:MAG: glycosyltransferase [Candidatus Kapaibacterium sp.]